MESLMWRERRTNMKQPNIYRDNPDFVTTKEACDYLGVYPLTFYRYVERFCIDGHPCGKFTYYLKSDIEVINNFLSWGAAELIVRLEAMTGCIVTLKPKTEKK